MVRSSVRVIHLCSRRKHLLSMQGASADLETARPRAVVPRSQAPAWGRVFLRSSSFDGQRCKSSQGDEPRASGTSAFLKLELGNEGDAGSVRIRRGCRRDFTAGRFHLQPDGLQTMDSQLDTQKIFALE